MANKVVKFGGSSLADANQFRKVADIIKSDDKRKYVVPSAPGKRFSDDIKVTDMLYKCCELAVSGEDFTNDFQIIKDRYNGIISDLGVNISLDEDFDIITDLNFKLTADNDVHFLTFMGMRVGDTIFFVNVGDSNEEGFADFILEIGCKTVICKTFSSCNRNSLTLSCNIEAVDVGTFALHKVSNFNAACVGEFINKSEA